MRQDKAHHSSNIPGRNIAALINAAGSQTNPAPHTATRFFNYLRTEYPEFSDWLIENHSSYPSSISREKQALKWLLNAKADDRRHPIDFFRTEPEDTAPTVIMNTVFSLDDTPKVSNVIAADFNTASRSPDNPPEDGGKPNVVRFKDPKEAKAHNSFVNRMGKMTMNGLRRLNPPLHQMLIRKFGTVTEAGAWLFQAPSADHPIAPIVFLFGGQMNAVTEWLDSISDVPANDPHMPERSENPQIPEMLLARTQMYAPELHQRMLEHFNHDPAKAGKWLMVKTENLGDPEATARHIAAGGSNTLQSWLSAWLRQEETAAADNRTAATGPKPSL